MIKINLLPVRAAQKKEKLFSQVFVLVAGLLVIIAGCGFVHFSLTGKIADQREENQRIQSELSSLRKKIGQVGKFKKLKKDLEGKLAVLKKLKDAKSGPVHLLDELTMALPEKIWIDSYRESSGNISIAGTGLNEESVAQFMENLESSPYYKNVNLGVIEQKNVSGNKIHSFSLSLRAESPETKDTTK